MTLTFTEVLKRLNADAILVGDGRPTMGMIPTPQQWAAMARIVQCSAALIDCASVDLVESTEADQLVAAYESAVKEWPA